jgi:CPA1 family monovalent cation:H+ antiporter
MPWPAAIALGAIVAPPDAAAATAVLRHVRMPHRVLVILEGESLLNDATALLIYRLAVGAVVAQGFDPGRVAPAFFLAVAGSLIVGPLMAWFFLTLTFRVRDVPTSIILQFLGTFSVWVVAEKLGLSPILTVVAFAVTAARQAPRWTPARMRLPSYAVWETTVFVLNVAAFVFIGLQVRPIMGGLDQSERTSYLAFAGTIFATVVIVRIVWVMACTVVIRWFAARRRAPRRGQAPPRIPGGFIVAWSGMRGIVTLAAALALPTHMDGVGFPFRDLIIVAAFSVVLGTLVLQGLTLRMLVRSFDLTDGDPVGGEVSLANDRALKAALATFEGDTSRSATAVREELNSSFGSATASDGDEQAPKHDELRRRALAAARRTVLDLRDAGEIGDDAFHVVEEHLDHLEISDASDDTEEGERV